MADTLSTSICTTLADYRNGEIPPRTPKDVDRWITQFDATDRDVVLAETDRLLKAHYVSNNSASEFIDRIWSTEELVGKEPQIAIGGFKFLDIQRKGESQKRMLDVARTSLKRTLGVNLDACGQAPAAYIYLDDCLFSGNTVLHDVEPKIPELAEGTMLHLVFLGAHNGGARYLQKLTAQLKKRKIELKIWRMPSHAFHNFSWEPNAFQLMWPTEVKGDAFVDAYIERLKKACEGKQFSPRLFRPSARQNEDVFSSPAARQVVESAFLRKGAFMVAQCQNPKDSMRPLGYEYLTSLGFGALIVTYRNIANNCPLALWWGDPDAPKSHPFSKWFPLIPRKGNQQTALASFDVEVTEF